MSDLVFVDTNVLIYNEDHTDIAKLQRVSEWLDEVWTSRTGRVSWQVMAELNNNLRRKVRPVLNDGTVRSIVSRYFDWKPVPPDEALFRRAWALQDRHSLSWWDALIVAAAAVAGCRYLLSEDMQAGQDFDGVRLVNPFQHTPEAILRAP